MGEKSNSCWERISIAEAQRRVQQPGSLIRWRPEEDLPEERQYALIYNP